MHEVRFKGKHIAWDKIERHYHNARSGIKMALQYIKIKLKAMRKDRVKIRINDGITWNKMKANNSVKVEVELRWHYIDEIKWMAMIKNKLSL